MLIAHISDFHVFSRLPETALVRRDAEAVARQVAADLATFSPAIDVVCFTGDLTDGGLAEDYALLSDILSVIKAPIFVVPGNHDKRSTLRAAFAGSHPFEQAATLHYEVRLPGVRILALDTLIEGAVHGRLDREQLDWLRFKLETVASVPTLLLMHHPAFPSGISALDDIALVEGRQELGEIVARYPGALRILSGHIHRPFQGLWNGAFCAVAGSPAFQQDLVLDPAAPQPGAVEEPYAYFIHRLGAAGQFSVHARYVAI